MTRSLRTSVLAAAAILILSACSASVNIGEGDTGATGTTGTTGSTDTGTTGGNTYEGNGVSFSYPEDWQELESTGVQASTGGELWTVLVGPGPGADTVILTGYPLQQEVNESNVADVEAEIVSTLTSLSQQAGGAFDGELTEAEMGGLPGFEGSLTANGPDGQAVTSTVVLVFDGSIEYFLNCQYEPDGEAEVQAACEQVRSSFQVTG